MNKFYFNQSYVRLYKMFFSILKWVFISLTLIFLVHHLYMFLMNTLTVPKIKDLVNKPTQQYQDLYNTMGGNAPTSHAPTPPLNTTGGQGGAAPLDELSSFLSDLKKKNVPNGVDTNLGPGSLGPGSLGPNTSSDKFPSTLGSIGGEMGYSLY
jgi:hypothetical protein